MREGRTSHALLVGGEVTKQLISPLWYAGDREEEAAWIRWTEEEEEHFGSLLIACFKKNMANNSSKK